MMELERALEILKTVPVGLRMETAALEEAPGRVLAREVVSPIDSPPFDKSAMDGFALPTGDDGTQYRIRDTVPAGSAPERAVERGECARIMTGAMLPSGTDRVVRKELVEEKDGIIRLMRPEQGDNVIRRGASVEKGQAVLSPKVLRPQDIGILAASGIAEVPVAIPPVVGVISTGPEIRPPGGPLGRGQIYDSNGPLLRASLAVMRCPSRSFSTAADEPGALHVILEEALSACDVVLVTGGVSAGDFDYVPECLEDLGAEILFHGVAIKPGKPTLFARRGERSLFGMPGNPVSAFVIFELFVKPFLYRRMGIEWAPPVMRARLLTAVRRRNSERTEFLPVSASGGGVAPVAFHGSSHMNALNEANGLIRMDRGVAEIAQGTEIDVRSI